MSSYGPSPLVEYKPLHSAGKVGRMTRVTLVEALANPMVRIVRPIGSFWPLLVSKHLFNNTGAYFGLYPIPSLNVFEHRLVFEGTSD